MISPTLFPGLYTRAVLDCIKQSSKTEQWVRVQSFQKTNKKKTTEAGKQDRKISLNVTLETNEGKEQGASPLRRSQTQKSL